MKRITLISLAAAAMAAPVRAQNLIMNPGFELSPPGQSASIPGWTAMTDVVSVASASAIGVSGHGGDQVLDLGGSFGTALGAKAEVYQDIFIPAGAGTLSFKWGQRLSEGINHNRLFWVLGNAQQTLATASMTPFPAPAPLDFYSTSFTANAAGTYRLRFSESGGLIAGAGTIVDDVVLTAIPEPATMAVLGLGVLALRRRRNRAG